VITEAPGIPKNVDWGTKLIAIGMVVNFFRTIFVQAYLTHTLLNYRPDTVFPLVWVWLDYLVFGCLLWTLLLWRIRMQSAFCRAVLVFLIGWNFIATASDAARSVGALQIKLPAFATFLGLSYILVEILYVIGFCNLYSPSAGAWFKLGLRGGLPKAQEVSGPPPLRNR